MPDLKGDDARLEVMAPLFRTFFWRRRPIRGGKRRMEVYMQGTLKSQIDFLLLLGPENG